MVRPRRKPGAASGSSMRRRRRDCWRRATKVRSLPIWACRSRSPTTSAQATRSKPSSVIGSTSCRRRGGTRLSSLVSVEAACAEADEDGLVLGRPALFAMAAVLRGRGPTVPSPPAERHRRGDRRRRAHAVHTDLRPRSPGSLSRTLSVVLRKAFVAESTSDDLDRRLRKTGLARTLQHLRIGHTFALRRPQNTGRR